jgi:hypothetical protein
MSWFAGYYNPQHNLNRFYEIKQKYDYEFSTERIQIWADSINVNIKQSDMNLAIICGTVLKEENGKWFISNEAWLPEKERSKRKGHFIGLNYYDGQLEFYNDPFALRELYYYKDNQGTIYFSTRVDILLGWKESNQINWEVFGNYWLIKDPLGREYFVKGINRLNQAGKLLINQEQIKKTNRNWTAPEEEKYNTAYIAEIENILRKLLIAPKNSDKHTILALSGGYDSRAILALILANRSDYSAVTWGNIKNPDIQISCDIARNTGIEHSLLTSDLLSDDNSWQEFYNYCGRSQLVNMGTAIFELFHYRELDKESVLIDGGAGELIRRCLNANLEYRGRNALYGGDIPGMLSYISAVRADIFCEEHLERMRRGMWDAGKKVYSEMPDIRKMGISNWLETWNIRQRIGNISSRSQQILDDIIRNFMPYTQKEIIEIAMKIPGRIRAKNHIHKLIIRKNAPLLTNYPTVRNGLKMPYITGRISGKARAILFRRWSYQNNTNKRFLELHKERISAMLEDAKHNLSDIYSRNKLKRLSEDYWQKGLRESEMIWWLTFEVFRQQFNIRN